MFDVYNLCFHLKSLNSPRVCISIDKWREREGVCMIERARIGKFDQVNLFG